MNTSQLIFSGVLECLIHTPSKASQVASQVAFKAASQGGLSTIIHPLADITCPLPLTTPSLRFGHGTDNALDTAKSGAKHQLLNNIMYAYFSVSPISGVL